jgi:hypothetical protein
MRALQMGDGCRTRQPTSQYLVLPDNTASDKLLQSVLIFATTLLRNATEK